MGRGAHSKHPQLFPSAISRYLVSNRHHRVHPVVDTRNVSIRYIAVLGFQPLGTVLTCQSWIDCFHPLYRGTWFPTGSDVYGRRNEFVVSIRYIAVLGFQQPAGGAWYRSDCRVSIRYIAVLGFQLLEAEPVQALLREVSIRYIAVLGFQHGHKQEEDGAIMVSIRYIAVLGFQRNLWAHIFRRYCVSIRYIAVLGFQHVGKEVFASSLLVSIRYIAVLGFQPPGRSSRFL